MGPAGGLDGNWSAVLVRELMQTLFDNGTIGQVVIAGERKAPCKNAARCG
jgi:hypothetical protein